MSENNNETRVLNQNKERQNENLSSKDVNIQDKEKEKKKTKSSTTIKKYETEIKEQEEKYIRIISEKDDFINNIQQKVSEYEIKLNNQDVELLKKEEIINNQNKAIIEKDKKINLIVSTNSEISVNLDNLRKEIDNKFEKINILKAKRTMKKDDPLEVVIKLKEKEIKNCVSLIEILKRDKEDLQKKLNSISNYNEYIKIQDRLKIEEMKNKDLLIEIKTYQKYDEEYKKFTNNKSDYEKEIKAAQMELIKYKELTKELKKKLVIESEKHEETKNKFLELKLEAKEMKNSLMKDEKLDKKEGSIKRLQKNISNQSNIKTEKNKEVKESIQKEEDLFSKEEEKKVEGVLSPDEISKLKRKYSILFRSYHSLHLKSINERKKVENILKESQSKVELSKLNQKEEEQKNKILSFQLNDYKNEVKVLKEKIGKDNLIIENLKKDCFHKESEVKKLIEQFETLKDITKKQIISVEFEKNHNSNLENKGYDLNPQYNKGLDEELNDNSIIVDHNNHEKSLEMSMNNNDEEE